MTRNPFDPAPMVISNSVLAACTAWGAEVRRHGNGRDARAMLWAMIAPADVPSIALLRFQVGCAEPNGTETLDCWADDGGATGDRVPSSTNG